MSKLAKVIYEEHAGGGGHFLYVALTRVEAALRGQGPCYVFAHAVWPELTDKFVSEGHELILADSDADALRAALTSFDKLQAFWCPNEGDADDTRQARGTLAEAAR
jgi:hypothetical protein